MDGKSAERKHAKVYFRIFPTEKMNWDYVKVLEDQKTIYIRCLQELCKPKEGVLPTFWIFPTNAVFHNNTQAEIYENVIANVLDNVAAGKSAIVMAFGQTGTGKSLTIGGLHNAFEDRGILPRLIQDVLKLRETPPKSSVKTCIQVSYIEATRANMVDLLQPKPIKIIKDIVKVKVKSVNCALKLAFLGEGRKEYSNNGGYPSHCASSIFTFHISKKNTELQNPSVSTCQLHVIDLAGCNTVGNFSCLFKQPHEVGTANLVKSQLEQFLLVLCSHIPERVKVKQRLNLMIQYLGESLRNTSVLRFIGHIRVSREDLLVTISMLRFGQLVSGLKASKFEEKSDRKLTDSEKITRLQKELGQLQVEITYKALLSNQKLCNVMTEKRSGHIERVVNEYLQNKITKLTLMNVTDVEIALEVLKKNCIKAMEAEAALLDAANRQSIKEGVRSVSTSSKSSSIAEMKKIIEERNHLGKSKTSLSAVHPKSSKDRIRGSKADSVVEEPRAKSRSSGSSVARRSSTGKKNKSNSSVLLERSKDSKLGSKHAAVLIPDIIPEHADAWSSYISERNEQYQQFVSLFEFNEAGSKKTYEKYLAALKDVKAATEDIEKWKKDLLSAQLTRQFQNIDILDKKEHEKPAEIEVFCQKNVEKARRHKVEMQEALLSVQSELKVQVAFCKDIKKDLKNAFEAYCMEKFQAPIEEVAEEVMNIHEIFAPKPDEELVSEAEVSVKKTDVEFFEDFKRLMVAERRKRELQGVKKWITYS